MAKLNKEQVSDILNSIHPKDKEDPVDKYTELLKTVSNGQNSTIDPMLLMFLGNNNSNKSMDKLYEAVAMKQVFKMLNDDDNPKNSITDLVKSINEATDKKIQAMQEAFLQQLNALKEIMPKPKSEETMLLEKIAEKIGESEKKGDTDEVDKLVKLIAVIQGSKQPEKDPLDTFSKMYAMVNAGNEKYIGLKEDLLQQQNDATMQQLNQALHIIDQQKNNSDWMGELRKSTQTINQFKSFMEESGLKPVPQKTEGGKVDLKYILDTVSEVVKNIAPNLPPPRKNPTWDVDKEAQKLYSKYKDILGQEDGKPLTLDFVKNELQKNPNVENLWQSHIKKAYEDQMKTGADINEPIDTDAEIAKMFQNIENTTATAETTEPATDEAEPVEEEPEDEPQVSQGKHIKGMSA